MELERSAPLRLRTHPQAPQTQSWRRWALRQAKPRAIDLFAGCGGLSLGLQQAGYSVVLSLDNDPWALETHRHNIPGVALDVDLSDPGGLEALLRLVEGVPIALVAGGPPCQPFSRAGRAKIRSLVEKGVRPRHDERTELWQSFLYLTERMRPTAVLMENVPDMALGDDLLVLNIMTEHLERTGYEVRSRLLDAWRYGVPQHRQRLILVAVREGYRFEWPAEQRRVTVREAIGDLPRLERGTGSPQMKARRPRTMFQKRARQGMEPTQVVWDHVTRPVRNDDREAFRLLKPGTRYGDLPEHLRRYRSDIFNDKYNRLAWDDLSRSITAHIAKDGYWYIHPAELRTITVREAARIQTFPDHFRFAGSRSHAFRQIGNAVPPALGRAVGRAILKATSKSANPKLPAGSPEIDEIRARLLEWARKDAKSAPWRHPGRPWPALVGIVLGDRAGGRDRNVHSFLREFPRVTPSTEAAIRKAAKSQRGRVRKRYEQLAKAASAAGKERNGWKSPQWTVAARLGPAEKAVARTLIFGNNGILASAPALRVVARLSATNIDEKRRLSDGRMALGRLIGIGTDARARGAALHALGRVVCTAKIRACERCPLKRFCASAD